MAATSNHRSNTLTRGGRTQLGGKAHHTRCNGRNHFLNATFASIPGCEIPNGGAAIGFENDTISRLRGEVEKFYARFGIVCELPQSVGNFKKDMLALYSSLQGHLPNENWNVEVVRQNGDDGPVKFVVYTYTKFPEYSVWAMPIKRMAKCDDKTRKLLALTFAVLNRKDMYEFPDGNADFQFCLGQSENDFQRNEKGETMFDEEQSDYWDDAYKELAVRYLDGDISRLFDEIKLATNLENEYQKPLDCILEDTIRQYRDEKYNNPHLLDLVEQELGICREGWLSEYHLGMLKNEFGYDFAEDDGTESEFMDFARIFFLCYDSEDGITQSVIDCLNSEACNLEIGCLCCYSFIDSDDVKERMESSYPERWAEINNKLIMELQK